MTSLKKLTRTAAAALMVFLLANNGIALAEEHVVTVSELHQNLLQVSRQREANIAKLRHFFSSEPASRVLDQAGIGGTRVADALSFLDSEELAQLAARVDKVEKDFSGGALTNQQLTYIVIALATAVIILVIVAA